MDTKKDFAGAHDTAADPSAESTGRARYASVVTVNHFHAKEIFLLADYFIPRCDRYFSLTFGQSKDFGSSNSIRFTEYCLGKPVREKILVRNQWASFFPRYVQLVFWFTVFALRFAPRGCWIMTPHPPLCLFERALRSLKKQRFVLILADIFEYDSNRLSGRIFNRYVRRCARTVGHVLYMSPEIQKRHDVFAEGERSPVVRKRWSLGITKRFDERDLAAKAARLGESATSSIGYVGVVRSCVGLENLIEYARRDDSVRLDIVGEGPYAANLRNRCQDAGVSRRVVFHGFVSSDKLDALAGDWLCGTMLYDTDSGLYTRYTEPGKAKLYLSLGVPILMTDVSYIADEIRQRHAGIVLPSADPPVVAEAVAAMRRNCREYVKGAVAMANAYEYERKYDGDFAFMQARSVCAPSPVNVLERVAADASQSRAARS